MVWSFGVVFVLTFPDSLFSHRQSTDSNDKIYETFVVFVFAQKTT